MTLQDFYKLWPIGVAILGTAIGWAATYGKVKEKMSNFVTKEELSVHCEATRRRWSDEVGNKIAGVNTAIKSMEALVIRLHNSQSKKIDTMDDKREGAKGENNQQLSELKTETSNQFIALNKALGRLEGKIEKIGG